MSEMIHIGQILTEHGVLSEQQVFEVLAAQRKEGVPFGVLAEQMFDVTIQSIERAWIDQYSRLTGVIDLEQETVDETVLGLIHRRQAWQFEMMPLRYGENGELVVAASPRRLARAVTFLANKLEPVAYFRIALPDQLRQFMGRYYPMPEVSNDMLNRVRKLA
jgi:hypothetical protein